MSIPQPKNSPTCSSTIDDTPIVALRDLGTGSSWAFPGSARGFYILFAMVDTFTKWIEAEPITSPTATAAMRFFHKNVVTRFGIPSRIITDNRTQFASGAFLDFYDNMGTTVCFAFVAHPQRNRQVKQENGLVVSGVKRCLHAKENSWFAKLPTILWVWRTMTNRSIKDTPLFLVYRDEAILHHEVKIESPRVDSFDEDKEAERQEDDLNLRKERRGMALICFVGYQQALQWYHAKKVPPRKFKKGDLVLRLIQDRSGKLSPTWEGPYEVVKELRDGSNSITRRRRDIPQKLEYPTPKKILCVKYHLNNMCPPPEVLSPRVKCGGWERRVKHFVRSDDEKAKIQTT